MSEYLAVIGLETHVQLLTESKMFCGCANRFGAAPNSLTCPVCLGLPGALPVPNRAAVALAIRFALAVGAEIHGTSVFARKNYFYPDLPKGYQISQYEHPIATGGRLRVEPDEGPPRWIRLARAHLEEDAGKSVHEGLVDSDTCTGIDLNRCGVPLLEVVTEPDLTSPDEAHLFLERLKSVVRYTGVGDANMEEGSLRVDANVSVHRAEEPLGTRVEIKNLNSFRHVRRALRHEIERHVRVMTEGGALEQETRLWDEGAGETRPMRGKEEADDYRYFPDPDLPPLVLDPARIERERDRVPELPHLRRDRFVAEHGLRPVDAKRLTVEAPLADYFELTAEASGNAPAAANWVLSEVLGALNREGVGIESCPLDPEKLAGLIRLIDDGTISGKTAKDVFDELYGSDMTAEEVVDARGWRQVTDEAAIRAAAEQVLADHPSQVEQYRGGKAGLLGFLVGKTIRATGGTASPALVRKVLEELLGPAG
jgi:aspartyl-tRNA(Asn)/glutamyl-tRNA(Gln) amidotransferase subunit B